MKFQIRIKELGNRSWRGARLRRGRLYLIVASFLVILVIPFPILPAMSTNGVGWLDGWSHRKSHVINPAPGAGTNYQVKIIVHYGYGTDSGADVYCSNHCRLDFGDIRFTDNDGVSFLDYWIEEKTDSDNATFWVEVTDDLSSNNVTIYLYYGNVGVTTTSNGDATFLEFTHFNGTSLPSDWTVRDTDIGTHSVSDSKLTIISDTDSHYTWQHRIVGPTSSFALPIRAKALVSSYIYNTSRKGPTFEIGNLADMDLPYFHYDGGHSLHTHYDGSTLRHNVLDYAHNQEWVYIGDPSEPGTWELVSDTACNKFYSNGVLVDSLDTYSLFGSVYVSIGVCSGGGSGSAGSIVVDWLFVSKFVNPEPTHGSWEGEQYSWLTGWSYRKSHIIENASGADTNYHIKVVVHWSHGIDNISDVYCNNHCRTDFGDVRFTDDDGVTLLDYWMEENADYDRATFWVKVADNLSDSDALIYVYYGNIQASSTSNGESTFIFFDDFESGTVNSSKWDVNGTDPSDTISVVNDPAGGSNKVLRVHESGDDIETTVQTKEWPDSGGVAIGLKWRRSADYYYWASFMHYCYIWKANYVPIFREIVHYAGNLHRWWNGSIWVFLDYSPALSTSANVWYKLEYKIDPTYVNVEVGGTEHTGSFGIPYGNPRRFSPLQFGRAEVNRDTFIDGFYVRRYVSPEPEHRGWGNEEFNWLAGWNYRKGHTINAAPGAGTNYQVMIIVHYSFGVDSEADVYCGNRCKADFGDIRFTDDDGITLLDYWMEEKVYCDRAIFWVEIADNLSSDSALIYMYYGNSEANTTTSGENTFIFFDDFSSGLNAGKWHSEGNVSVLWNECWIGGSDIYSKITTLSVYGTGCAARAKSAAIADLSWLVALGEGEGGDDWLVIRRWQAYAGTRFYHGVQDGGDSYRSSQASTDVDNNYHISEIRWINGSLAYTEINGRNNGTTVTFSTTNVPDGDYGKNLCFKAFGDLLNGTATVVDWCLVRKCVYPEPTHGAWEGSPTDDESPLINYIAYSPTQPSYLEEVIVTAEVLDHSGLSSVILQVNYGYGWVFTPMYHDGGTMYNTTIPAQPNGTQVSFLIEATDTVGNAINSTIYNYTVSDIPPGWTNFTIDATSTLNVMLEVFSNQSIQVDITGASMPGPSPLQRYQLGSAFRITAGNSTGFFIVIHYYYTTQELSALDLNESTLAIYYWNWTDNSWYELSTSVDAINNELVTTIDHLTIFAVFSQAIPLDGGIDLTWLFVIAGIGAFVAIGIAILITARASRVRESVTEPAVEPEARPTYEEEAAPEEPMPEEIAPRPVEAEIPRPLPTSEPICSYCGHQNPSGARFCIKCGRHLGEVHS